MTFTLPQPGSICIMTKESLSMRPGSGRLAPAKFGAAILISGGLVLLGACSSSTNTSSSAASKSPATAHSASPASAATCKHVASMKTSLESLTHQSLSASAATQIRKDLTNIQTQLAAIKMTGNSALSSQVSAVSSSLSPVEKAAKNMSSPPTSAQIEGIIKALGGLKTKSQTALASMKRACPNA